MVQTKQHNTTHVVKPQPVTGSKSGKLTPGRIVLLRELHNTPEMAFSQLRLAYFGKERAEGNKATTAFYMALQRVISFGWIEKVPTGGYRLSSAGKRIIEDEIDRDARGVQKAVSQANLKFNQASA